MAAQIDEAGEPFRRISVDEAKALIERGGVQIVDVRQPREYVAGHVSGSILIPLDTLLERSAELSADHDLLFVCAVGERSAVASEMAASLGRTSIFNMEGGLTAWASRGFPVER